MKKIILFVLLVFFSVPVYGEDFQTYLNKAEKASNVFYPKLKSYTCDIKTSQFDVMMKKMTASIPSDMPRPERPNLKKYWHYKKGMVVVLEGKNVFPYMQEFSKKMVSQFALELNGYFLPNDKKKIRDELLKKSNNGVEVKDSTVILNIIFETPMNVDNIFYKQGLPLPTDHIKSLSFEIDKSSGLVQTLRIKENKENEVDYELKANYENKGGHNLLSKLILISSDGSISGEFVTEFGTFKGYYLPVKQTRILKGKNISYEESEIIVEFSNYLLNKKIPAKVYK
jgi:hypothetical protein